MSRNLELVHGLIAYWGEAQDVESLLALCHDDVVYRLHTDPVSTAYTGDRRGKEAVRELLYDILSEWDYLEYEAEVLGEENGTARLQCRYRRLHRPSGNVLTGSKRVVVRVKREQVSEIDVFEDAPMVGAFLRLAESSLTADPLPGWRGGPVVGRTAS